MAIRNPSLLDLLRSSDAKFRHDVAALLTQLPRGGEGLIATRDAYWSAVGIFALLAAGARVRLPANFQPEQVRHAAACCGVAITDQPLPHLPQAINLKHLPAGKFPPDFPDMNPSACLYLSTSGSTGAAKTVSRTLRQLECEAASIEALLGPLVPADAAIHGMVPVLHAYGLAFHLAWPLSTQRPIRGNPHEIWETALASLEAGDVLITGPAHLRRIQGIAPLPADRRPSLVLSAGGPLPEAAAIEARAILGCPIIEILGSTEAGAIAWRYAGQGEQQVWRPMPGVRVTTDDQGVMVIHSPHAAETVNAGADRIRLLGTMDGAFEWLGRVDSILKIEGKRISPRQVEEALCATDLASRAAVFALDEQLAAIICPTPAGAEALAAKGAFHLGRTLRQKLQDRFEPACLPRRWRFLPALPEDAIGKHSLPALRAAFVDQEHWLPLVTELRRNAEGIEAELAISPDLTVLQGHFPDMPIVPGVAQLDWIMALANQSFALRSRAAQNLQVKFSNPMRQGHLVKLLLRHRPETQRLHFEYRSGDKVYSSGTIMLDVP